jgi:cytochrome P450
LLDYVGDVVKTRYGELERGAKPGENVVDFLLAGYMQGGADPHLTSVPEVIGQVVGLLVAWAASVSRSMAYAIDAMLDQPDAIRKARDVARDGDHDGMWELLQEALRWQPPVPAIERLCLRAGPVHGETVRRERDVSVVLTAVTMDKQGYPEPRRFGLDRGRQDNLTFGHGLHRCLGFEIARQQMSGIALSLLRRDNVQRACKLQLVGPYPDRLDITMDPAG